MDELNDSELFNNENAFGEYLGSSSVVNVKGLLS